MTEPQFDRLTPREGECLRMVRALKSSDHIARELGIAPGTVNGYIRDAVAKLGAHDRRHAALLYAEHLARRDADGAPSDPEIMRGDLLGIADPVDDGPIRSHADDAQLTLSDVVQGERRSVTPPRERAGIGQLVREVLDGTRPDEMTLATRALFTLVAAVAIGFCFFAISAGAGMLFSIADFLRRLAS
jgi:DNA-binding CsgD family transcriptional regulator